MEWSDLLPQVWGGLISLLVGLMLLAGVLGIYPRRRLVWLAMIPAVTSFLLVYPSLAGWSGFGALVISLIIALNGALLVAAIVDLCTVLRVPDLQIQREYQRTASLRQRHEMGLLLANPSAREVKVSLRDGVPSAISMRPDELEIIVRPTSRVRVRYHLRCSRRGAFRWEFLHLRLVSRRRLWQRFWKVPQPADLNVYPDMRQLAEYELLARTNRLNLIGLRRTRRVGQDHDFERLRDYTRDDNYKHIDWRTTARRRKLTVRDFQSNQSQQIVFLVDCGRMMTNHASGISLLDHALNSMLMLSYIALRRGDSVGLVCFSDAIHAFVPPRSGTRHMNQLLHASFDRFPRFVESRYDEAFLYLATHCRRRALVVLMTNVIDHVNAGQIREYLTSVVGHHLPLGVLLRDHELFDPVEQVDMARDESLYRASAAAGILNWRHQVLTDLQHRGVLSLDVFPENLTAPLINRYLDIKARGLL